MTTNNEFNLDIKTLLKFIFSHKFAYLITLIVSAGVGVIIAFSIPKSYTTKVLLAPESSKSTPSLGSLGSLASIMGANFNGLSQDAIYPEIYPEVVSSTSFIVDLMKIRVVSQDKSIKTNLFDYLANHQRKPWWMFFSTDSVIKVNPQNINPSNLTKEQWKIEKKLNKAISCSVDSKTDVITIKATAQDPLISAILADSISTKLQQFMTEYRTSKAKRDLAYVENLFKEAKQRYEKARKEYAAYSDSHQDLMLQEYQSELEELENDMQLQYNMYTQYVQQLQAAQAKLQERTPIYAVLQPASVPERQSAPKRVLITLACIIVGLFGYTVWGLVRMGVKSL